jgi:hypothetical protein
MGSRSYDRQFKMAAVKSVMKENRKSAFPGHGSALFNSQNEVLKKPVHRLAAFL